MVLLDVLIDREGRPREVEVFRGEEPFASSAVTAAYDYVFYPAIRSNGVEINAWVELTMPFAVPAGGIETAAAEGEPVAEEDRENANAERAPAEATPADGEGI